MRGRLCTLLNLMLFRVYIPSKCTIGRNCILAYGATGLVIHPRAVIGDDCLLSPGVVIGGRGESYDVPVIEDGVSIFPGAKVLGPIRIGEGAQIGANAVVVEDLEKGRTAVAPKARIL